MRRRKSQDEVITHILHAFGHHVDQITMIFDRSGFLPISPTRREEEDEEGRDQGPEKRPRQIIPGRIRRGILISQ